MSRHDRGNEAATAATLFVSPAHALSCTVFVHVRPLRGDPAALVKKKASRLSHGTVWDILIDGSLFLTRLQVCVGGKSLSRRTSSE